jgi:hypothetical protein
MNKLIITKNILRGWFRDAFSSIWGAVWLGLGLFGFFLQRLAFSIETLKRNFVEVLDILLSLSRSLQVFSHNSGIKGIALIRLFLNVIGGVEFTLLGGVRVDESRHFFFTNWFLLIHIGGMVAYSSVRRKGFLAVNPFH